MRHQPAVQKKIGPAFVRTGAPNAARCADPRHPVLRLQSAIGNRAVQRLIRPSSPEEGGAVTDALYKGIQSPERGLDRETRAFLEQRFGYDFSGVRVHTDSSAAASAEALNAKAYTSGQDIVFGEGTYDPVSSAGRELIAHEVAHVVQQSYQPNLAASAGEGELSISEPSDDAEREADLTAQQIMSDASDTSVAPEEAGVKESAKAFSQMSGVQRQGPDDFPDTLPEGVPGPEQIPPTEPAPAIPDTVPGPGAPGFVPESQVETIPGGGGTPGGEVYNPPPEPVPEVPGVPEIPGPIEPIPPTLPSAGVGVGLGGEGAGAGAAGLGAEAALPLTLAAAAGVGAGIGMADIADSSYTKTGAFGVDPNTGQNQSAMDWGANWGTSVDKALGNTDPSILGGIAAGAGGIVGGIGGAGYGAYNWLKQKL